MKLSEQLKEFMEQMLQDKDKQMNYFLIRAFVQVIDYVSYKERVK